MEMTHEMLTCSFYIFLLKLCTVQMIFSSDVKHAHICIVTWSCTKKFSVLSVFITISSIHSCSKTVANGRHRKNNCKFWLIDTIKHLSLSAKAITHINRLRFIFTKWILTLQWKRKLQVVVILHKVNRQTATIHFL